MSMWISKSLGGGFRIGTSVRTYPTQAEIAREEKRNFIDSISNGYPVPLFLLAIDENGNYEIIDGMQRLDALCTFIEQKYELIDGYFNLESMPDTLQLKRNNKLKQKKSIISLQKCKEITNYPLPVSVFSAKDNNIEEVFSWKSVK